jgi:hypothetical protein
VTRSNGFGGAPPELQLLPDRSTDCLCRCLETQLQTPVGSMPLLPNEKCGLFSMSVCFSDACAGVRAEQAFSRYTCPWCTHGAPSTQLTGALSKHWQELFLNKIPSIAT